MINKGLYSFVLAVFCFTTILYIAPSASAQGIKVLGEIRAEGSVLIGSSDGKWAPLSSGYPLLQSTSIKTADGVASIYFRDGSRISLSKDTMAVVDGTSGDYSVSLSKGVLAFNISPSASLSVMTASGSVTTRTGSNIVQKVSYEEAGRVLGVISTGEKGTDVRSISGRLTVNINASEAKFISTGESLFMGPDSGGHTVYRTQALRDVPSDTAGDGSYSREERTRRAVLIALFLGGSYAMFHDNWKDKGIASPSR